MARSTVPGFKTIKLHEIFFLRLLSDVQEIERIKNQVEKLGLETYTPPNRVKKKGGRYLDIKTDFKHAAEVYAIVYNKTNSNKALIFRGFMDSPKLK